MKMCPISCLDNVSRLVVIIPVMKFKNLMDLNSDPNSFFRLRAFFHGYSSKDSLDRCIDNVCMFPTEDSLYLLTDAAMALKVDPETLDTTDEVRNKSFKKVPESSQNVKTRVAHCGPEQPRM